MDEILLYHFNDVYHISQVDLVSKFGRIITQRKHGEHVDRHPLTVFSGDAFSPSLEATLSKGAYMGSVLNHLNVDVACYGNHDFDFGEERLRYLSQSSKFPWTLCNAQNLSHQNPTGSVAVPQRSQLLAKSQSYVIQQRKGYKIGFFGLAGTDWPLKCQRLPPSQFKDPVKMARIMAKHLRRVERCDFVVAITHMRLAEDLLVSEATANHDEFHVDLLLGGHDHEVVCRLRGESDADPRVIRQGSQNTDLIREGCVKEISDDVRIVKSGSDFKSLSSIKMVVSRRANGTAFLSTIKLHQIVDLTEQPYFDSISPLPHLRDYLDDVQRRVGKFVKSPVCRTIIPLEGRSTFIRSQETNLGNMIADAVNAFHGTQISLVNSGTIRSDALLGKASWSLSTGLRENDKDDSLLRVKDIIDMTPFHDEFVMKRVQGACLLQILENSVSDERTDGRFLQCSGLRFIYDEKRPHQSRVLEAYYVPYNSVRSCRLCAKRGSRRQSYCHCPKNIKRPLRINRNEYYTVTVSSFLAKGFDGYDCFKHAQSLKMPPSLRKLTLASLMLQTFGCAMPSFDCEFNEALSNDSQVEIEIPKLENAGTFDYAYSDSGSDQSSSHVSGSDPESLDSDSSSGYNVSLFTHKRKAFLDLDVSLLGESSFKGQYDYRARLASPLTVKERIGASRERVIIGRSTFDGLPIISPLTEGRVLSVGGDC